MSKTEDAIIEVLKANSKPMNPTEISELTGIALAPITRVLNELLERGAVQVVTAHQTKARYFTIPFDPTGLRPQDKVDIGVITHKFEEYKKQLDQQYVEFSEGIQEKQSLLNRRLELAEESTRSLYANIIAIMSIFIALFSLIIVNVNVITTFISMEDSIRVIFIKMGTINAALSLSIAIFVTALRLVIVKPLLRKKDK